jgi:hypothetical protein
MLYIFQDFHSLQLIHKPLPKIPEFIKKKVLKIQPTDEEEILGDVLKNPILFPKDGIQYYLKSKSHSHSILFHILHAYYISIHPEIEILLQEEQILIKFHSYQAVRRNFELMYALVKKVLKSQKIDLHALYNDDH